MRSRSHKAALTEGREARRWYLRERGRLSADHFQQALGEVRIRVRQFPESGQLIEGHYRRILIDGFPYQLIYAIEQDTVVILAVAHSAREPFYWSGRR